jgi:hypothetical protein
LTRARGGGISSSVGIKTENSVDALAQIEAGLALLTRFRVRPGFGPCAPKGLDMPLAETPADPKAMPDFLRLVGADLWTKRLADLGRRAQASAFQGRATQHRHALEFARRHHPRAFW